MRDKRPVYLNLFRIRLPVTGFVSILHRMSGVVLFLLLPFMLRLLEDSVASEASFEALRTDTPFWARSLYWVLLLSGLYHLLAGARHFLMDMHIGHTLPAARRSAFSICLIFVALAVWISITLWRGA